MRKILLGLLAMGSVALLSTAARAQCGTLGGECLINGNLDTGTAGDGTVPGTALPWTVVNDAGHATAGMFQPGFADNTGVNGFWYRAFLGSVASPDSSTLAQTVVVPTAGTYTLSFDKVIEQNFTATSLLASLSSSGGGSTSIDLLTQKVTDATYTGGGFSTVASTAPTYNIHSILTLAGVNAGDTLTVSVAMVGGHGGVPNPQSAVIDNFSLQRTVPEPACLALGLIGLLGTLGLVRRR
jgi:hypothetical protein